MIHDIWTVMWKELKELFEGGLKANLRQLAIVGVFGVFLPLQFGRAWVESTSGMVYGLWVPLFLVTTVVAQAFAGERERHTLETLLATRLPDSAILLGKVAASVAYGWGIAVISLLTGLVVVNGVHASGELLWYPGPVWAGAGVGLLVAHLVGVLGVLISLRAATVRQAQQVLSIGIMMLFFIPVFAVQSAPAVAQRVTGALVGADLTAVLAWGAGILVALNAALLRLAMLRFRRSQIILD